MLLPAASPGFSVPNVFLAIKSQMAPLTQSNSIMSRIVFFIAVDVVDVKTILVRRTAFGIAWTLTLG
jgi:hypothetical protein